MKKVYIAFSVHGTEKFLVATKDLSQEEYKALLKNSDFAVVQSRGGTPQKQEPRVKLHWKGLVTKDGKPLRSPPVIMARFKQLVADYGFTMTDESKAAFTAKHWAKK